MTRMHEENGGKRIVYGLSKSFLAYSSKTRDLKQKVMTMVKTWQKQLLNGYDYNYRTNRSCSRVSTSTSIAGAN